MYTCQTTPQYKKLSLIVEYGPWTIPWVQVLQIATLARFVLSQKNAAETLALRLMSIKKCDHLHNMLIAYFYFLYNFL